MPHIFSTASSDTLFVDWTRGSDGVPIMGKMKVLVKGGANVADKHMITAPVVMTEVTEEQLAFLETQEAFNNAVRDGFYTVGKKTSGDKVLKDMQPKDRSAPSTDKDFTNADAGKRSAIQ